MKYLCVLVFLLLPLYQTKAQNKTRVQSNTYIDKYHSKLNVRLGLINDVSKIIVFANEDTNYSLSPNESLKMQIAAQYDFLLVSYSYIPNFLPGNNDNSLKGETTNRSFGVNLFFNRVFGRLSASNTKGYYLENTEEIFPNHPEKYVLYGSMQKKQLHIEMGFNFNRNFSYKAFTVFNERQKRSCGSFIPRFIYSKNKFEESGDDDYHERIDDKFTISGNYIHTFLLRKHLYITAGVGFGGGISFIYDNDEDEVVPIKNYKNPLVQAEFLFQIGHNSDRFFYGYSAFTRANGEIKPEIDNAFADQSVVSQVYFGYRFTPPKLLVKTFDGAKSIFLRDKDPEENISTSKN